MAPNRQSKYQLVNIVYRPNTSVGRAEITEVLHSVPGIRLDFASSSGDLATLLPHADGLVMANPSGEEAAVISLVTNGPHRLKWLHLVSSGQDGIAACRLPPEVRVSNTPGATANAVGDHAIALVFALMRRLHVAWEQQRARLWSNVSPMAEATTIDGKIVVVLGYGEIGKYLHRVFDRLGAIVRVVSRRTPAGIAPEAAFDISGFAAALQGADILICAIPLTETTRMMVDDSALRRMKRGAFVVNVGRGQLIARDALMRSLLDGHLAGAGLDVTDPEPLDPTDELWSCPNAIITPHYAGVGSSNAPRRMADAVRAVVESHLSAAQ